jgi:xanthine dehydrogenase accessory factor
MVGYDVDALYGAITELRGRGQAAVLVTIVEKEGSGPALPGTKMLVTADGAALGTVGGGALEQLATQRALDLLVERRSQLVRYALGEDGAATDAEPTGMICGGRAGLFFDYLGYGLRVCVLGAGHVGKALVGCLQPLHGYITVVDPRPEMIAGIAGASRLVTADYVAGLSDDPVDEDTFYVIATPGHAADYAVLKALLAAARPPRYVGLMGSRQKVTSFVSRLRAELGPDVDLSALYAPVGLDLGGASPEEVAFSIAAEIQALRNGRAGNKHLRQV